MFIFLWEGQKEILRMYVNSSGCFHLGPQEVLTVRLSPEDFFLNTWCEHMFLLLFFIYIPMSQGGFSGKLTLRISCSKIIGSITRVKGVGLSRGRTSTR